MLGVAVPLDFEFEYPTPSPEVLGVAAPVIVPGRARAVIRIAQMSADGSWHAYTISGVFVDGEMRVAEMSPRDVETANRVLGEEPS